MEEEKNVIVDKWTEAKAACEAVELDLLKNARGTVAAGSRARKGLRALKARLSELVKLSNENDKAIKAAKKAKKAADAPAS